MIQGKTKCVAKCPEYPTYKISIEHLFYLQPHPNPFDNVMIIFYPAFHVQHNHPMHNTFIQSKSIKNQQVFIKLSCQLCDT